MKRIKITCDGRIDAGYRCGNEIEAPAEEAKWLEKPGWLHRKTVDFMMMSDGTHRMGERTCHYCPNCVKTTVAELHPNLLEKPTPTTQAKLTASKSPST